MEEEGLQDLMNALLQEAEYYDKDIDARFFDLSREIKDELRAGNFKNRTGNLRRSMEVYYVEGENENAIAIEMLRYGYFVSFGVNGFKYRMGIPLTEEVQAGFGTDPYTRPNYRFGDASSPVVVPGIRPRRFYPLNIEERIIEILNRQE